MRLPCSQSGLGNATADSGGEHPIGARQRAGLVHRLGRAGFGVAVAYRSVSSPKAAITSAPDMRVRSPVKL